MRILCSRSGSRSGRSGSYIPVRHTGQTEWEKPASGTLAERLAEQLDFRRLECRQPARCKRDHCSIGFAGTFRRAACGHCEAVAGVSDAQGARALAAVQALEPAGVGARSLSECLCLQLERCGQKDEALYRIARNYLDELARRKYAAIASALGISAAGRSEKILHVPSLS